MLIEISIETKLRVKRVMEMTRYTNFRGNEEICILQNADTVSFGIKRHRRVKDFRFKKMIVYAIQSKQFSIK